MTISSENRVAGPYIGNDAATAFPFAFKVFGASDLQVVRTDPDGAESTLTLTTDYTVSLNANQDSNPGGTVTLPAVLATGYKLTITSNIAPLQATDLTNQGGFYPKVITNALDKLTILIQQIFNGLNRSIKLPISNSDDGTLPAGDRANTVVGFDALGKLKLLALQTGTSLVDLAASDGASLIGFIQSGSGAVERTVEGKLREWVSVKDFGAVGDGVADDSHAFIKARTYAATKGLKVRAPAGHYKLNQVITSGQDLILEGDGLSTILDFTGTVTGGDYALEAVGTATQIQDLGATATAGTYTVTFASSPSLADGEVFVIYNPTNSSWSGFRANYFAGEWCEVESISGNAVTVRNQLYDTYTAADVDVYKITGPRVLLRDFEIRGSTVEGLITTTLCIAPRIENVKASHANNSIVYFDRCFKPSFANPDLSNVGDGGDDYGIVIGSSQHARINGGYIYARRHAVTCGGAANVCDVPVRDARISGATIKNDTASGVFAADFHGNTEGSSYIDCTIYGGVTWQGKDIEYVNCTITADQGGRVVYSAEIKGGRFSLRGCKLITHVDPSTTSRGIVDIGGNNSAVSANTILPCTFSVENCDVYGRNMASITTSFMVFKNNGASIKTNFVIDGLKGDVNAFGQVLYTDNVTGTPSADFVIVDRIAGFPSGTYLHNSAGYDYANFPHRCQRQAGSVSLTATSGTNNTIPGYQNFKYIYPRTPAAFSSTAGSTTVFNGNRPILANIFDLAADRIRPVISTGDAVAWTATSDVTYGWSAHIDEV